MRDRWRRDRGKDSSPILKLALGIIIASIVMTILTLMIAVVTFRSSGGSEDLRDSSPIACVECTHLTYGLVPDFSEDEILRQLTPKFKNGKAVCCAYNSQQMTAMFEAMMRRVVPPEEPLPSYNVTDFKFSPASAHKLIHVYPRMGVDNNHKQLNRGLKLCSFNQTHSYPWLEHNREVKIHEDGIEVQHRGLYYVYSSVTFRPYFLDPCKKLDYQTFIHSVWVKEKKHKRARQILTTTYTCCDDCVNNQESRFTGGLFQLEPGDLMQVKVIGYELVHFEPESCFAGLVMMGGFVN